MADRDDSAFLTEASTRFREAETHWAEWRDMAREAYGFYAGDQWSDEDRARLDEQLRPIITFNRASSIIDVVSGSEVQNRQAVRYIPREQGDAAVSEVFTGAADYVRDECDAEDEETEAFLDALICGVGWTHTHLDVRSDPEGAIVIERVDPLLVLPDPRARKRNLADKRFVFRLMEMSVEEAIERWGEDDIGSIGGDGSAAPFFGFDDDREFGIHDATNAYRYTKNAPGTDLDISRQIKVVEYQYQVTAAIHRVVNPETQAVETLDDAQFKQLRELTPGYDWQAAKLPQVRWRRAYFAGGKVLEDEPAPVPEHCDYHAITAKRDRNHNRWHGLMRAMIDPQRWSNKFFSETLNLFLRNSKGGVMVEQGAIADPRQFEEKWADPSGVVMVNAGALSRNAIVEKKMADYPQALDRLMGFSVDAMPYVTGVNVELMGLANRQQAGVLEAQRKQAGITILAGLFDGLRRYRKDQGRCLLRYILDYLSDGRLIRILGDEGEKYVPLIRQAGVERYDVVVDESPTSPNMKEKVWGMLVELVPMMLRSGVTPPPDLLDYTPLPSSLIEKWKEHLANQGESQEQQQMVLAELRKVMAEAEKLIAQAEELKTQADLNRAKVGETMAKAHATMNPPAQPMNGDGGPVH